MGLTPESSFSHTSQTFGDLCRRDSSPTLKSIMGAATLVELNLQRRVAMRYALRLPVIFHWNDGVAHTEGGFTSDIALDGVLILSTRCPPAGSEVRIEVLLPSPVGDGEEIRIECVGKVVRVTGTDSFGVRGVFDDSHLTAHVHR